MASGDINEADKMKVVNVDTENLAVELSNLTIAQLKNKLRALKLPVTGKKVVLIERLKAVLTSCDDEETDEEADEESTEETDQEADREDAAGETSESSGDQLLKKDWQKMCELMRRSQVQSKSIRFQDVADTIPSFSGDKGEHVVRWLSNFEVTAEMANWSEVEKIINAKRKLVDSAKIFVQYECRAKTWTKFKNELVKEFAITVNSKQVHKQLQSTKKREDESLQEFVYRMLQIASQIEMEEEAQIQYIIEGIPDDERNKTILYGASTIKELRIKLKNYEVFKHNLKKSANPKPNVGESDKRRQDNYTKPKRCFNCGGKDHLSSSCPNKDGGPKCFKCGEYGHIAPKCSKSSNTSGIPKQSRVRSDVLDYGDKKTYKIVKILDKEVKAVIDPGSDLHLIRSSMYLKLGAPELKPSTVLFDGVGSSGKSTLGKFSSVISIDGIRFNFVFEVIPDYYVGHDLIIGGELSDYAEVKLRNRQAVLSELVTETEPTAEEILNINVLDEPEDDARIDVSHVLDPEIKKKQDEYERKSKEEECSRNETERIIEEEKKMQEESAKKKKEEECARKEVERKNMVVENKEREECERKKIEEESAKLAAQKKNQEAEKIQQEQCEKEAAIKKKEEGIAYAKQMEEQSKNTVEIGAGKDKAQENVTLESDSVIVEKMRSIEKDKKLIRKEKEEQRRKKVDLLNRKRVAMMAAAQKNDQGKKHAFAEYCEEEKIDHHCITTGVPRGNGQVERLNRVIISVLTKLSIEKPMEWFKHLNGLQQMLNSTLQRSIGRTPFELLVGTRMRLKDDVELREFIEREMVEHFAELRRELRDEARANILKTQEEQRKTFNKRRKEPRVYEVGELVAIQRTQFGSGLKLAPKFFGPYKVTAVMRNHRYLVEKIGEHEGPKNTSTSADLMKSWPEWEEGPDDFEEESEDA